MARQSNLAYDLAMFDEAARRKAQYERKRAELQVVKSKAAPAARQASPVKGMIVALFALGVCSAMLYSQVQINELHSQISEASQELEVAQSENVRLQSELDARLSLSNVEEYATEKLGLQKLENSQVEYITLDLEDVVVFDGGSGGFFERIKNGLADLVEYLGF